MNTENEWVLKTWSVDQGSSEKPDLRPDSREGLMHGSNVCPKHENHLHDPLIYLLSIHGNFLRCIYPESCLLVILVKNSYLDAISNGDGFAVSSR